MISILHVTDAAFSGALYAITDMAREQAKRPDTRVAFAYVPRPESPDLEHIRALAGPDVHVERLTTDPRFASPMLLARLRGVLRRTEPDILHLHSSRTGMIGRFVALLDGARHRTVYSPHGFAFERTVSSPAMKRVYTGLERAGARMAPALALCSPSEQRLAQASIPGARTTVLANAVDVARMQQIVRDHRRSAADAPLEVVHVARITEQKLVGRFGAIAESWSRFTSVPARFRWIGDGDRSLLPDSVEVTGWLEREEMLRTMANADVLLFTSAGEAMPMSLLESQAMGIPAVASRVVGVTDVVEDGVTGLLGETEDELRSALVSLAEDPARRHALGVAGTARMSSLYDMSSLADRSFAAYSTLGIRIPDLEGAS
jgi:glycosyltransferase involved in cell wall biosynthesis